MKRNKSNKLKQEIKVIVTNPKTKDEADKIIDSLGEFLNRKFNQEKETIWLKSL